MNRKSNRKETQRVEKILQEESLNACAKVNVNKVSCWKKERQGERREEKLWWLVECSASVVSTRATASSSLCFSHISLLTPLGPGEPHAVVSSLFPFNSLPAYLLPQEHLTCSTSSCLIISLCGSTHLPTIMKYLSTILYLTTLAIMTRVLSCDGGAISPELNRHRREEPEIKKIIQWLPIAAVHVPSEPSTRLSSARTYCRDRGAYLPRIESPDDIFRLRIAHFSELNADKSIWLDHHYKVTSRSWVNSDGESSMFLNELAGKGYLQHQCTRDNECCLSLNLNLKKNEIETLTVVSCSSDSGSRVVCSLNHTVEEPPRPEHLKTLKEAVDELRRKTVHEPRSPGSPEMPRPEAPVNWIAIISASFAVSLLTSVLVVLGLVYLISARTSRIKGLGLASEPLTGSYSPANQVQDDMSGRQSIHK